MASLLRHGARRMGVSVLPRTQAAVKSPAVEEERCRLLTRRITTDELPRRARTAAEIQHMKEELYETVIKHKKFVDNHRLLEDLAVHVPRPWDKQWRGLRRTRRVNNFAETTGIVFLAATFYVLNKVTKLCEEAVKQVEAKMENEKKVAMERENQVKSSDGNQ